ncbi:LpxL/LpxP family Kdo(2)-lipid IV(A) lauroyl/palmitoleoyl acyltransferase [Alkanindiges sp. WGS2144]|uniref:LpxL/LpxP family Kdo(2)-lipid IV(A) lauroyl/palmitoleoyl acyltransferase n=1 Tax=Alkanindiges sp. WGS2144 TaxID=3366808 RepID=UPI00374FE91E
MSSHSTPAEPRFSPRFLAPKYWGIWLGVFLLLPWAFMPWPVQRTLGAAIGRLLWKVLKSRRKTTLTNLRVCYPGLGDIEYQHMGREVFENMGIGIFESLTAWYNPQRFNGKVSISGLEHLQQAQHNERGILLLGLHSTLLDAGGLLCSYYFDTDVVYRPQNNPMLDWLIYRSRSTIYDQQIDHDNIRLLVRRLKEKHIVWYSPDQDFGLKQGVMAPFYGVPAATVTAQRRLIKMTNAAVMSLHFYRQDSKKPHYHIHITPALENYPTHDEIADATTSNHLVEQQLDLAPTQYMWFHRRFKTRPEGYPPVY